MNTPDELHLRVLRELAQDPRLNQRSLAQRVGLSVGKANYCLQALVAKGLVKIANFRRSDNKLAYSYLLTPSGLQEKTRLTVAFLKRKQREYEEVQLEIARLQDELAALRDNEASDLPRSSREEA